MGRAEFNQQIVIRLWEEPTEIFLTSSGLLLFAVLSQSEKRKDVLFEVGKRIDAIPDRRKQSNLMASAALLAGLVLKKEIIQKVLRQDIMQESVIYQEIKAEGIAEGKAEGIAEGIAEKAEEVALNLLKLGMSFEQVVQVTGLTSQQVQQLQQRQ